MLAFTGGLQRQGQGQGQGGTAGGPFSPCWRVHEVRVLSSHWSTGSLLRALPLLGRLFAGPAQRLLALSITATAWAAALLWSLACWGWAALLVALGATDAGPPPRHAGGGSPFTKPATAQHGVAQRGVAQPAATAGLPLSYKGSGSP